MKKTKKCQHCKQEKPFNAFSKNQHHKDKLEGKCKSCASARRFRSIYGITVEQRQRLFDAQNGCCAICGKHETELKNILNIDHDHKTGIIRGLLCWECNKELGLFINLQSKKAAFEKYLKTVPKRMTKVYKR